MRENQLINLDGEGALSYDSNVKGAIAKLRLLSPVRMRRIHEFARQQTEIRELLIYDEQRHSLGADRLHWLNRYSGMEGKIVYELLDGATGVNPVKGDLWAKVLVEIGSRVTAARRAQIYAELLDTRARFPYLRIRLHKVMAGLEAVDPEVAHNVTDGGFFIENMMDMQEAALANTFSSMFGGFPS